MPTINNPHPTRFHHLGSGHPFCTSGQGDYPSWLPFDAVQFLERIGADHCDGAVMAVDGASPRDPCIGFVRFFRSAKYPNILYAGGTWVSTDYRRTGLATLLWDELIAKERPACIDVVSVSPAGQHFVQSLHRRYPHILFHGDKVTRGAAAPSAEAS